MDSRHTGRKALTGTVLSSGRGAASFVLTNKMLVIKGVALIICLSAFYSPDLSIVLANALKFTTGNIANYTIIIPFLSAFIIYRKRKILQAVAYSENRDNQAYPGVRLDDIVGITLCSVAVIAYIASSATLYALEFHLVTLPFFLAGGVALLFNLGTLKHLIVAIFLLLYLQPPPGELVSELAADLSWASAVLNHALLSTFGMPIELDPSFGAPALVIQTGHGKVPFFVGEPSSGVFSTISLSLFAIFVSYIIRGKVWKRIILFILGFPLFFVLNTFRIGIVITLWYLWGPEVSEAYHSISGALMVVIGTITILTIGERVLKLRLGTFRPALAKCLVCGNSKIKDEFCQFCGRITNQLRNQNHRGQVERIALIAFLTFIAISATGLKAQTGDASKFGLSKLDISSIEGKETLLYFLPSLSDWKANYAYRDSTIESILNQDASLAYRLSPNNVTSIMSAVGGNAASPPKGDPSKAVIFTGIQISTGHHMWEDSLVTAPSRIGRPGATILESGEISINADTKGHFLLFKRQGFENTEAVVEWFERGPLKVGSHFENRNILISIWSTTDSLASHGLIDNPADSKKIKRLYLSVAKPIALHWERQLDGIRGGEDLLYTYFNHNGFFIAAVLVFTSAIFWAYYERRKEKISSKRYQMYSQLVAEDKAFMDTLIPSVNKQKYHTGEAISKIYEEISGKRISASEIVEKLKTSAKLGLVQTKIASDKDEPLLIWKPLFRMGRRYGKRKRSEKDIARVMRQIRE